MPSRPLTREELEILRRSAAATGQLPRDQLSWLIAETDRLLVEREKVNVIVEGLKGPWPELRRALNELHRLVQ